MAANNQPVFPLTPKLPSVAIANTDAQNVKTLYAAGSNGGRMSKLVLVSTDTSARDVGIYLGSVLLGTVSVPAGAGNTSAVAAKDVLADPNFKSGYYDANGNLVIDVPAAGVIGIQAPVTVTSGKTITGHACAADF